MLSLGNFRLAMAAGMSDSYFVTVIAAGGWDTTSVCDPKGDIRYSESRGVINRYSVSDIRKVGNLRYAPMLNSSHTGKDHMDTFFKDHYRDIRVYNGLNFATNSHPVGRRTGKSGSGSSVQPDTAALLAAMDRQGKPLAYYLGSGSTVTGGSVSASRLNGVSTLERLAKPFRYLPNEVTEEVLSQHKISTAQVDAGLNTVNDRRAMREYLEGHADTAQLNRLLDSLPDSVSSGAKGEAEIAAAAFSAGVSNSAQIQLGGFDTHNSNDSRQHNSLMSYFNAVNHLIAELERQGVADRTTILLCSDFGRTPYYNSQNGKDHWNVGSTMVWSRRFPGNRVIGATDGQVKAVKLNPDTLEPDPNGVILRPAHLHLAFRDRLGLLGTDLDAQFPLNVELLDLLS
ncbi:DUF1501 domain-containing protein [Vibrio maritimus]|uniref:DUF1501 domain-containing protein n=1 Tax=Vibrio maritimus TaxID=990268 RepID=UPI001F4339C1|nr:DUF1501 domain-containing protein [Vibrio maritimus]